MRILEIPSGAPTATVLESDRNQINWVVDGMAPVGYAAAKSNPFFGDEMRCDVMWCDESASEDWDLAVC